jgi:hypothetical protein
MWPKSFIAILMALCLVMAVGMAGLTYAGDSPYNDDPTEEHPWGGDHYGDGGQGLPGTGSGGIIPASLPPFDGSPYYIQRIILIENWSKVTRFVDGIFGSTRVERVTYIYPSTSESSTNKTIDRGARAK